MTIQVTWEAVIAISGVLTILAAVMAWYIRSVVRDEVEKLDTRYVLDGVFIEHARTVESRLNRLEGRRAA